MLLHYPMNFECWEDIKFEIKTKFQENIYFSNITNRFSTNLKDKINDELKSYNLKEIQVITLFKRTNQEFGPNHTHMDNESKLEGDLYHSSIVFPIENCNNTAMYWYYGNYTKELFFTDLAPHLARPKWLNDPDFFEEFEIIEPTVTRVDIPHSAYVKHPTKINRVTLSIRLEGNPSIEEIVEKIKNKSTQ